MCYRNSSIGSSCNARRPLVRFQKEYSEFLADAAVSDCRGQTRQRHRENPRRLLVEGAAHEPEADWQREQVRECRHGAQKLERGRPDGVQPRNRDEEYEVDRIAARGVGDVGPALEPRERLHAPEAFVAADARH